MIPLAPFGSTGHRSTRPLFGAAALSRVTQAVADGVLDLLQRHGVNHIDTAASYGDAELRVAPWLRGAGRDRFFVATKTGRRTYAEARDEIRRSLERLGTGHLHLLQLHNLVAPAEWETAFGPDQPLRDQRDIDHAVRWVLSDPRVFPTTVGDVGLLPLVLGAASRGGERPPDAEMDELLRRRGMSPLFTA